jgi:hypothetical protein
MRMSGCADIIKHSVCMYPTPVGRGSRNIVDYAYVPAYRFIMVSRNFSASGSDRWKELRPMIEPKPPPSRIARTSVNT